MADPTITIGLPVYNGERYLAVAINSLLAQTYPDFEVVVCDNASTDGTPEIAQDFQRRDPRVRVHRNRVNLGSAGNYSHVVSLARGRYFRWAACDDLSAPTFLERCLGVLEADPTVVLAYPRTRLIDGAGTPLREYDDKLHNMSASPTDRFILVHQRLGLCNAMYGLSRTAALRRTHLLGRYIGSDMVFHAELSLYGKFYEIPERLFFRRMHEDASSSFSETQREEFYQTSAAQRQNPMRHWRFLWEYGRAVWTAPIPASERARLYHYLTRAAYWDRRPLLSELGHAVRAVISAS